MNKSQLLFWMVDGHVRHLRPVGAGPVMRWTTPKLSLSAGQHCTVTLCANNSAKNTDYHHSPANPFKNVLVKPLACQNTTSLSHDALSKTRHGVVFDSKHGARQQ